MNARVIALVSALALAGPGYVAAQAAKPAKFEEVIEAKFRAWDKNGDGKLSAEEINDLVVSDKVTGDEAAAVAAIHSFYREHAKTSPVTKPQLTARGSARNKAAKDIAEHYGDFREHIKGAPSEVFTGRLCGE